MISRFLAESATKYKLKKNIEKWRALKLWLLFMNFSYQIIMKIVVFFAVLLFIQILEIKTRTVQDLKNSSSQPSPTNNFNSKTNLIPQKNTFVYRS